MSVGEVIATLDQIVNKLFQMRLSLEHMEPGESYDPFVLKTSLTSISDNHVLGYIYFDLKVRAEKYGHPTHYTLEFSRKAPVHKVVEEKRIRSRPHDQPGRIVIAAELQDLFLPRLSLHNASLIFHEFGHALHNLISSTELQHVAGVRCPTDYVEMPSTLMENWGRDHRVLSRTLGREITEEQVASSWKTSNVFPIVDLSYQIALSLFDLKIHMATKDETVDRTFLIETFHKERRKLALFDQHENEKETWPFATFQHLGPYGGGYYGYLMCTSMSSMIWQTFFQKDPFSSESGARFKKVLEAGNSADPLSLLNDLFRGHFAFSPETLASSYVQYLSDRHSHPHL